MTVLEHELGHVIGLADNNQAGDLMDTTLGLGVRRAPTSVDVTTAVRTPSAVNRSVAASRATVDAVLEAVASYSPGPESARPARISWPEPYTPAV